MPLYVHSDACQAGNYLDMQVARLGVDLLYINTGKVVWPKANRGIICSKWCSAKIFSTRWWPRMEYPERYRKFRANIAGFRAAWHEARRPHKDEFRRLSDMRDKALHELTTITGVSANGASHQKDSLTTCTLPLLAMTTSDYLWSLMSRAFRWQLVRRVAQVMTSHRTCLKPWGLVMRTPCKHSYNVG